MNGMHASKTQVSTCFRFSMDFGICTLSLKMPVRKDLFGVLVVLVLFLYQS